MGVHLLDATGSSAEAGRSCGRLSAVSLPLTVRMGVVGGVFLELEIVVFLEILPRGGIVASSVVLLIRLKLKLLLALSPLSNSSGFVSLSGLMDFLHGCVDGVGGGNVGFISNFLKISSNFVHFLLVVFFGGGVGGAKSWEIFWGGMTCFLVDFLKPLCLNIEMVPSNFKNTFWPNCGWGFFFLLVFNLRDFLGVFKLGLLFRFGVFWGCSWGFLGVQKFGLIGADILGIFGNFLAGSSVPPALTFLAEINSSKSSIFLWKISWWGLACCTWVVWWIFGGGNVPLLIDSLGDFANFRFGLVGGWAVCTVPMLGQRVGLGGMLVHICGEWRCSDRPSKLNISG